MFARIKAVAGFINSSKAVVGEPAASKLQKEQVRHLLTALTSTNLQLDEASAIMQYLATGADGDVEGAFSDEDRAALAGAVVTTPEVIANGASNTKAQNQSHYYMHKYLTESDWKVIMGSSDTTAKLRTIVNRAGVIGLTHPSELSVVAMVAIITSSSRVSFGADAVHNLVRDAKRMIKGIRPGARQSCRTFPMLAEDFIKQFPGTYADELPADCPLTDDQIERERGGLAARKSHRTLSHQSTGMPSAGSNVSSLVQTLASAIVGTMAHRQPDIPLTFFRDGGGIASSHGGFGGGHHGRPPVLALTDKDDDGSPEPKAAPPPPVAASPQSVTKKAANLGSMDDVLATLGATLFGAKPAAAMKRPSAAAMKRPAAAAAAADDDDEDGEAEPAGEPYRRPTLNVISTRSNVCVRTGVKGPGQSKCFSYSADGNQGAATKKAKKWLTDKCHEQGIEVPDDL